MAAAEQLEEDTKKAAEEAAKKAAEEAAKKQNSDSLKKDGTADVEHLEEAAEKGKPFPVQDRVDKWPQEILDDLRKAYVDDNLAEKYCSSI